MLGGVTRKVEGAKSLQFGHMDTAMEAKKGDETAAETKHRDGCC